MKPTHRAAWRRLIYVLALIAPASASWAQTTPVGLWKTYDKETRQESALVRIVESAGELTGAVEQILGPFKADAVCEKCTDERKSKPIVGMTVLANVRRNVDDPSKWDGGTVLEVKTGKVYKVQLYVTEGGKTLDVRGYVGTPMLGRTQQWRRVD